jgi:UDP:flavonoid glycosyltransferase YjiC (YdhE family)
MRIDLIAPPFAGHLFPLLDLANTLSKQGAASLRVLTTADAAAAIQLCGLKHVPLLVGDESKVHAISSPSRRIGSNPYQLYRQFRMNLDLMKKLRDQLRALWSEIRPDLVIVDFTIPVAGLLARAMGIPWWTSLPSRARIGGAARETESVVL